jgi:solute carrier family 25 phosphate transporter 23/24/25/41
MDLFSNLLSGGISGIVSRTVTAPLELYKIQRQNPFIPHSTLQSVLKKEGIRHLWKGNGANCIRVFPQFSLNYATFEFAKERMPEGNMSNFLSGAAGGMIGMLCTYPLETIRTRLSLQTQNSHYTGTLDALKRMGVKQLYQGGGMSVFGSSLYNAFNFSFYFAYKNIFPNPEQHHKLLCGGFAGLSAITITHPTDLVRRRMQLQGFDASVPVYRNPMHCIEKIVAKEGVRGLYRGLIPAYIRLFPTTAIQFWTMELCNDIFKCED